MVSNHTGKTISSIRRFKNKIVVYFNDKNKIDLSYDAFSRFYLYKNKKISDDEYRSIVDFISGEQFLKYALKIINKTRISELKIRQKLYEKSASKHQVDQTIDYLKKYHLIDDETLMNDLIEMGHQKLDGKIKIKETLLKKGISSSLIENIDFVDDIEQKKAKELVIKDQSKFNRYSYQTKKDKIYRHLLSKGFTHDIALKSLIWLKKDNDDKLYIKETKDALKRWIVKNGNKYDLDKKRFEAAYKYLKQKGYSYNYIRKAWDEYYGYND